MAFLEVGAAPRRILCLGAHSDDIEIGCGGAMLALLDEQPGVDVHWVVFSASERRRAEAHAAAERILQAAGSCHVTVESFRDGYFPWQGAAIKDCFESLKRSVDPDLVLTHARDDRHQDHRTISDLTWNSFRDHLVLEYEIPKYDGDLGRPNAYVPLTEAHRRTKVDTLMSCFESQRDHRWFAPETFDGLMRLRGMECNAPSGYAEAFQARKLVLGGAHSRAD